MHESKRRMLLAAVCSLLALAWLWPAPPAVLTDADPQTPPATFYGPVRPGPGFAPAAGLPVTAWIGANRCGQDETLEVDSQVVYVIDVLGEGPGGAPGCGAAGRLITFQVAAQPMTPNALWSNNQLWALPLQPCPDFDGNEAVDVADIAAAATHWRQTSSDPGWDEQFDRDQDGDVDVLDIATVTAAWPSLCPLMEAPG